MKTPIKTLACATVASMLLLACNDTGTNSTEQNSLSPGKAACKSYEDRIKDMLPDDIDTDPACKSGDRIQVGIFDKQEIEFEVDGVYYSSKDGYNNVEKCAKGISFNGEYIDWREWADGVDTGEIDKDGTKDEYNAYFERRERCLELIWDLLKEARDIAVPCRTSVQYIDRVWNALLTEEEIAELKKTYNNISIVPVTYENDAFISGDGGVIDGTPVNGNGGDALDPCHGS